MSKDLKKYTLSGIILILVGGSLWGLSGTSAQYLTQFKNLTQNWIVPIRLLVSGFLLLLFLYPKYKNRIFDIWKEKSDRLNIIIFGLFGMMFCQYSYFATINYSNAGTATVLQCSGMILILIYNCIKNKIPPKGYEVLSIVLAVTGIFLLSTHGSITSLAISPQALFWGIMAAVSVAVYTLQPKKLMEKYDTPIIIGWGLFIGGIVLCLFFRPFTYEVAVDPPIILAMAVIIILGSILAFTFYLEGIKRVGPVTGSLLSSIEPICATLLAVVFLGTKFTLIDIVAFALIISTIFITSIFKENENNT